MSNKIKNAIALTSLLIFFISCSDNNRKSNESGNPLQQLYIDAEKGNAEAQFKLGFKYYYGDQVNLNRDSAKYWLNKSAENGHENARKTYDAFFKIIPSLNKSDTVN